MIKRRLHIAGARRRGKIRLNSKIKSILTVKKPLICEILMDPNEEQIPKAINKKNKDGKLLNVTFMITGKLGDMCRAEAKSLIEEN